MAQFTESEYEFYKTRTGRNGNYQLFISSPFEGTVHIIEQEHGGEPYESVEFIEFDSEPTPDEVEEIETYVENNLYQIMDNAKEI